MLVVRQKIAMLAKLIGTGTVFARPQLADFESTLVHVACTRTPPPLRPREPRHAQLRDIATSYARAATRMRRPRHHASGGENRAPNGAPLSAEQEADWGRNRPSIRFS